VPVISYDDSKSNQARTAATRAVITRFVHRFYLDRDVAGAFEEFVAPDYIQHNPGIADGRDAAVERLAPFVANWRATCSCRWLRRCTPTWRAARTSGQLDDDRSRQKETSGGRSETEVNDVAVKPTGGLASAVTTTTDAACRRSSARYRSGSMGVVAWSVRSGVIVIGAPSSIAAPAGACC
jgi:hypothetical protein